MVEAEGGKYPTVAAIAKDVLVVQVSTVPSESAFSTGGRVVNSFRSSLTPKSVEVLICLQSWLRGADICCEEDAPNIKDYEFYERCEKGKLFNLLMLLSVYFCSYFIT